jgi:putative FmdB family regulatory protein
MPIYAYRCASCGFEEEALQKVSEAPLTQCSSCGKPTLEKQVTAAGFQLKGSGCYVTDFRDNGKKDTKKSTDGGADKSASTETKSDSKPAESSTTPAPSTTTAAPAPSSGGDTEAA